MSLFSPRVPLYIFLPVIVACGAAGYIANTIGPLSTIFDQAPIHRPAEPKRSHGAVATSRVAEQARPDQKGLSGASAPQRNERAPANIIEPTPPLSKATPEPPRATRAVRAASKPRRPQRVRQPTSTPATTTGLKSIPLIGPVFSFLQ
jgi:hypothetical protein